MENDIYARSFVMLDWGSFFLHKPEYNSIQREAYKFVNRFHVSQVLQFVLLLIPITNVFLSCFLETPYLKRPFPGPTCAWCKKHQHPCQLTACCQGCGPDSHSIPMRGDSQPFVPSNICPTCERYKRQPHYDECRRKHCCQGGSCFYPGVPRQWRGDSGSFPSCPWCGPICARCDYLYPRQPDYDNCIRKDCLSGTSLVRNGIVENSYPRYSDDLISDVSFLNTHNFR